jgi:hypothetical protein
VGSPIRARHLDTFRRDFARPLLTACSNMPRAKVFFYAAFKHYDDYIRNRTPKRKEGG